MRAPEVELRRGAITGLAGLLGCGTSALLRRLFSPPSRAIREGIGLVPGERSASLVPGHSVRDNIVLPSLRRFGSFARMDDRAADAVARELIASLDIRPGDPNAPVGSLSGGNQQKVILARWLAARVAVLLMDEPTQGIDVAAKAQELHRLLPNRRLILGIDRLDYTKGIPQRLAAFQHLLARHPEMRGRVSLMQVVVPSREDIGQYHRLRTEIEQLVGKINGVYARPGGWVPVWYEYRSLSRLELLAYYRAADIALITPLKDGMNLVAKEYCACSIEEDCVLILSEFAGAAAQLAPDAILVNPYDVEGVAGAIRAAYAMPASERAARMRRIRRSIRRQDVFWWVDSYLRAAITTDLRAFPQPEQFTPGEALEDQLPL